MEIEEDQDLICVKSRTWYVVTLGGCPIHWTSKLQQELALSTLEAEYIALAMGMREFVHLRRFYEEMTQFFQIYDHSKSTVLSKFFKDNQGYIQTVTAWKMSLRTQHMAVKYQFVRNVFNRDPKCNNEHPFVLEKIASADQKSDLFTKGLSAQTFVVLHKLLCGW